MGTLSIIRTSVLLLLAAIILRQVPLLFRKSPPNSGSGFAAPGWRKVADVFRKNLDSGLEQGAAFALYHKGQLVVEFSGGYADYEAEVPWTKDTIAQVFSSAKGIAAITMAVLVDRGLLDYKRPVSYYWPEFGQNGKQSITVEQLFSHQAGLAVIDKSFSELDLLKDMESISTLLAEQSPNWTPAQHVGYHGHTLGLYMDQLVRRVDPSHRDLPTFFHEEIARPLGLEVYFGLPREVNDRAARVYDFNPLSLEALTAVRYWPVIWTYLTDPESITTRSIVNPSSGSCNNPKFQDVWNPSTHAFGTAISLARLFSLLSVEGSGPPLLSRKAVSLLLEPVASGNDLVLKMDLTYGRGTTLRRTPAGSLALGTPGSGGQMVYADPEHDVAWAYITNYHSVHAIGDDTRYLQLEAAVYESLAKLEEKQRRHG